MVICSSGRIVRLPDGKVYTPVIPRTCGTVAVDDTNDVIFGCGHHDRGSIRWALKLTLDGEDLTLTQQYAGGKKSAYGPVSGVFVDGRLFVDKAQVDPATGAFLGCGPEVTDTRKAKRTGPQSRHLILAANGHVYGLREVKPRKGQTGPVKGICEVYTTSGNKVAENILTAGPRDSEAEARWQQQGFGKSFSYSCSMNISGNNIYICSQDYLYCIGK